MKNAKHAGSIVFGPVPSRRLGLSLGVDIVPFKTCTLDCIYCQLGPTTRPTLARRAYVPRRQVLRAIRAALARAGRVDWITFSGSGEPSLHSGIGRLIRDVKKMTVIPVAVLTSGTLLADPAVREDLAAADLVVPDLDAGSEAVFRKVNRPHPSLRLARVAAGIRKFAASFPGKLWLEVVLVKGVNDSPAELRRMGSLAAGIRPERVQINTVVRPPADPGARPLSAVEMRRARAVMMRSLGAIPVDIVGGGVRAPRRTPAPPDARSRILASLRRRPATAADLAAGLGLRISAVAAALAQLTGSGAVTPGSFRGKRYYRGAVMAGRRSAGRGR